MTELSPAAQAMLDAAGEQPLLKPNGQLNFEGFFAAALGELASRINGADHIRADIIAIAAELEAS